MAKRWKYLMVIAGIGLTVVIALLATREREPEYGGKKLSEWVSWLLGMTGTDGLRPLLSACTKGNLPAHDIDVISEHFQSALLENLWTNLQAAAPVLHAALSSPDLKLRILAKNVAEQLDDETLVKLHLGFLRTNFFEVDPQTGETLRTNSYEIDPRTGLRTKSGGIDPQTGERIRR